MENKNNIDTLEPENKIKETILYGSIAEALKFNFISTSEILHYLLHNKVNQKLMVAYLWVCKLDREQLIPDRDDPEKKIPFILLTKSEEYIGIYNLIVLKDEYIPGRNEAEQLEIIKTTQTVWPKLLNNPEFSHPIHIITDNYSGALKPKEKWLAVGIRSEKLKHTSAMINIYLDDDYVDPLKNMDYKLYEKDLLDRCDLLIQKAPLYWKEVGYNIYSDIVSTLFNENKTIPTKYIKKYIELFADVLPKSIVDTKILSYNLRNLTPIIQAYVLGYPIHLYLPDESTLNQTIDLLEEVGIEKYVETVEKQNQEIISNHQHIINPLNGEKSFSIANEKDVLMEDISSYNSFFIIVFDNTYYPNNYGNYKKT